MRCCGGCKVDGDCTSVRATIRSGEKALIARGLIRGIIRGNNWLYLGFLGGCHYVGRVHGTRRMYWLVGLGVQWFTQINLCMRWDTKALYLHGLYLWAAIWLGHTMDKPTWSLHGSLDWAELTLNHSCEKWRPRVISIDDNPYTHGLPFQSHHSWYHSTLTLLLAWQTRIADTL